METRTHSQTSQNRYKRKHSTSNNDFLTNRKVTMNINGIVGKIRESSGVGLPQGSALSPILFRIYLMDLLTDLEDNSAALK